MSDLFTDAQERALSARSAARASVHARRADLMDALWNHEDVHHWGGDTAASRRAVREAVRRVREARTAVETADLVLGRVLACERRAVA